MTESSNANASSQVEYDTRGRAVRTKLLVNSAGTSRTHVYGASYDSGDRALSTTLYSDALGTTVGETLSYTYDTAWRPTSLHTSLSDVGNGQNYASVPSSNTYTALGGLQQLTLGNGVQNYWTYSSPMARVTEAKVVSGSTTLMDRTYDSYDNIGNITAFTDHVLYTGTTPSALNQSQSFVYDDLNRLSSVATTGSTTTNAPALNESYGYDVLGNLTNKGGITQYFPTTASARPHALTGVAGQSWLFEYDANGNTKKASGRQIEWDVQNMPTSVIGTDGVTESYTYDANGQRVTRTRQGVTTLYFGMHEEEITSGQSTTRTLYSFGGCTIQRTAVTVSGTTTTTLAYLHGDHLGSVSLTTNASGVVTSQQNYDAWGKVRSTAGGTSPTTINYTGQKRDDTGLLFYNARYYDPGIGRFLSADSIAIGKDSQSRNRYTYVNNNPINATDPTGHCPRERGTVDPDCDKAAKDADIANGGSGSGWLYNLLKNSPNWDTSQINDLLKWLRLGIRYRSGDREWGDKHLAAVVEGLDRIFNFLAQIYPRLNEGSVLALMKHIFGMDYYATLTFVIKTETNSKNGGRACPGRLLCYADGNFIPNSITIYGATDINTYYQAAVQVAIHELGHIIDFWAGWGRDYWSDGGEWSEIHYHKEGAVTKGAGEQSTHEDFAETFTWLVQTANGREFIIDPNNKNPSNPSGRPDDARLCGVRDALSSARNSRDVQFAACSSQDYR